MKVILLSSLLVSIAPLTWGQSTSSDTGKGADNAAPKQVDRSQYNLFNPTPTADMRDFMPDRPNVTDGPYTVDPGHWMFEVGLFEYTRDRYNNQGIRLDSFAFGDTNIRLGLTSYAELDFLFTAYTYSLTTDKSTGAKLKQSGSGDSTLRSKINFFGNDGGPLGSPII